MIDKITTILNSNNINYTKTTNMEYSDNCEYGEPLYEFSEELIETIINTNDSIVAISDIIIDHIDVNSALSYIKYKIKLIKDELEQKLNNLDFISNDIINQYNKYTGLLTYISLKI